MATHSELILARDAKYNRVERVIDSLGRSIGVKQLKPSQQLRVQGLASDLEGVTIVPDDDPNSPNFGKSYEIPKSAPLIMAASVVEIDGMPCPFAKSRAELDAILDALDSEGLKAVSEGLQRFRADGGSDQDGAAAAKN